MRCLFTANLAAVAFLAAYARPSSAQDPGYGSALVRELAIGGSAVALRTEPWDSLGTLSVEQWMRDHRLDAAPGEKVLDRNYDVKPVAGKRNTWFVARDLRPKRGQKRFSIRTACSFGADDEFIRLVDVFGPLEVVSEHFDELKPLIDQQVETACDEKPHTARRNAVQAWIRSAPNEGDGREGIADVLAYTDQRYAGDFYALDVLIQVIYSDGWALESPSVPLADLIKKRSFESQPEKWKKWRRSGANYELFDAEKNEWSEVESGWHPVGRSPDFRLEGTFNYASVSGSMYYGSFVSRGSYTFLTDGTYTASSSSQFGGNTATADMGSISSYSYCNEEGGGTQVSGSAPNVSMSSQTTNPECGDGKSGRYTADGYTLTLMANNGVTERLPFYVLDDEWIVIRDQYYTIDDGE